MNNYEYSRLDEISLSAQYSEGMNGRMILHSVQIFSRWILPGSILEMGPADGLSTSHLVQLTDDYEVLEGSREFCEILNEKFPTITVHNSIFEEFNPSRSYRNIVLGHVLEHVDDPDEIVDRCIQWLEPGGRIIAATPNSDSLHRQVAVNAGIISSVHDLTPTDISIGHRRVINPTQLRSYFEKDQLTINHMGGYYLKSFANGQIEDISTPEVRDALMILGEKYFEIAADIYIVATRD
jgi:hypothetical protein